MDRTDEKILSLLQGNARVSYQEIGDAIGMSRVAAKKRVVRPEKNGVIRGYNTCIYRDEDVTLFIDIVTLPCKEAAGMRDITAHKYQTLRMEDVFNTATMDLPDLKAQLTSIIEDEAEDKE